MMFRRAAQPVSFWRGLASRLLLTLAVIGGLALGSAGMTTYRAHPYLLDQVLGGQPAPGYVNEHEAFPEAMVPGLVQQDLGETMEFQRWEVFDTYRFAIIEQHKCPGYGSAQWYVDHHAYPNVMIVYRDDVMDRWDEPVAASFQVRPWSFDNLKGWDVWALCDR